MPGFNTDIAVHRLLLRSECKPVKQKLRRIKLEYNMKMKEEVVKKLDAGFLEVTDYPEWLASIVPVPKYDGEVRMCVK